MDKLDYTRAKELFSEIGEWRDSKEKSEYCQQKVDEQKRKAEEERIQQLKVTKRNKTIAFMLCFSTAFVIIVVLLLNYFVIPLSKYNKAEKLLEAGEFGNAYIILKELGEFNNADERILQDKYERALRELEKGDYDYGYSLLKQVGDYNDADQYILEHKFNRAKENLELKKYTDAFVLLAELGSYNKADEILKDRKYEYAFLLKKDGSYESAMNLFEELKDYKDSENQKLSCKWLLRHNKKWNQNETMTLEGQTVEEGMIVSFGAYEQDNILENGKEKIQWYVLDIQTNRALLLSTKILGAQKIRDRSIDENTHWDNSVPRKWLNQEFYNDAFSDSEKSIVLKTVISSKFINHIEKYNNDKMSYEVDSTEVSVYNTPDGVFCLSLDEIKKYLLDREWLESEPTIYVEDKIGSAWMSRDVWGIRNGTLQYQYYNYVSYDEIKGNESFLDSGSISGTDAYYQLNQIKGIRPAIWVDLKTNNKN